MWDGIKVVDARQSATAPGDGLRSCNGRLIVRHRRAAAGGGYFSVTRLV
jgi:hypothetical protein